MSVEVEMTVAELRRIRDLVHEAEEPKTVEEWEPGDLWVGKADRRGVLLYIGKAGEGGAPWIVLCRGAWDHGAPEAVRVSPTMAENAHQMEAVLGWRYLGRVSMEVMRHVHSKIDRLELHPLPGDIEQHQLVNWAKVADGMGLWITSGGLDALDALEATADAVATTIPADEALAELARNIARGEIDWALADIDDTLADILSRVTALERAAERAARPTEASGVFKPDAVRPGQRWRYGGEDTVVTILWLAAGSAFADDGVAYGTTRLLHPDGPWSLVADAPGRVWTIESYEPTTRERRTIAKLDQR